MHPIGCNAKSQSLNIINVVCKVKRKTGAGYIEGCGWASK